jgi:hypothetical protein
LRNRIISGITGTVFLRALFSPVMAQVSPSGVTFSQRISLGVGTYWPYHVLLMSMGFILILAGFIIARYHKTGKWYKTHVIFEGAGAGLILAGVSVGVYMVTLSGFPHLRNGHEILGAAIAILVVVTALIGYLIRRALNKNPVRTGHRWLGRISLALVIINIGLGLYFLSLVLGR